MQRKLTDDSTIGQESSQRLRIDFGEEEISFESNTTTTCARNKKVSTHNSDVFVNGVNACASVLLVQRAANNFLDGQNDTILATEPNQRSTLFNGFASIIYLEYASVWRKLRRRQIIL